MVCGYGGVTCSGHSRLDDDDVDDDGNADGDDYDIRLCIARLNMSV